MRVVLGILGGLSVVVFVAVTAGRALLRQSAIAHVQQYTRVVWPRGSRIVEVDQSSSLMSDGTQVLVELDAEDVPGFLASHPSLQPCDEGSAPLSHRTGMRGPPLDAGFLCAHGVESGPDWMTDWEVTWDPTTRRLTEEVSGFW
jgi:hypothetical protein